MPDSRSALIVGATGLVGAHCLQALLNSDSYKKVVVLVRRELVLAVPQSQKAKLEFHIVDFEQLENHSHLFQVDDVFCCLGTTLKQAGSIKAFLKVDFDYCLKVAELAKANGVPHFLIVTAVNANEKSRAYYSKAKGKLQKELIKLGFERLSIFQPSLLLGERENFRFGEGVFGKMSGAMNKLLPEGMSNFKAIEGKVVGKAMVGLARNGVKADQTDSTAFYHFNDMQKLAKNIS